MDQLPARLVDTSTRRIVHLTLHARRRIAQMEADLAAVLRAALAPDCSYGGTDRTGRTRVQRCDGSPIAVVYNPTDRTVVTVLWATTATYTRPDKEGTTHGP